MQCPTDATNLYDNDVIREPWPYYTRLRDKGPVVWMEALGNFALTQYDAVRDGLRDNETFISGLGAAADKFGCEFQRGNAIASDPPRHTTLRNAIIQPLRPDQISKLKPQIQAAADEIAADCVAKGAFDAVSDFAQTLPLRIVRDLVGLPDLGRENMLKWAGAAFDVQGIQNERGKKAVENIKEMRAFILREATPDKLKPGSWTHRIGALAASGELDPELAPFAIRDYINPSLDTTISAVGHLIFQLGNNPDQWEKLRANPSLAVNAAHEAVRIGSPLRSFARHTSRDVEIGDVRIPKRARVMMIFASANHDGAVFPDPDRFDVERRNARRHLGFGAGIHMCAGLHLAILEIECLIHAMIEQWGSFTLGTPRVALNNTIYAYGALPVELGRK